MKADRRGKDDAKNTRAAQEDEVCVKHRSVLIEGDLELRPVTGVERCVRCGVEKGDESVNFIVKIGCFGKSFELAIFLRRNSDVNYVARDEIKPGRRFGRDCSDSQPIENQPAEVPYPKESFKVQDERGEVV